MVTVETKGLFDGQFTKMWKKLYIRFSSKPIPDIIETDINLDSYVSLLSKSFCKDILLSPMDLNLKHHNQVFDEEKVVVAFSGGKDSLACVLKLLDDGYKPILFYVDGINRSYSTYELEHAKSTAELLNLDLYIYKLKISGKCDFIENPIKNQFILSLMVDYGLKYDINKYALGTMSTDTLDSISNEYMLSDCYELLMATESFYRQYIRYFELLIPLADETESYCVIKSFDKLDLLAECFSCMTPLRYKQNIIKTNERKYNVSLLPNRCGSCYKCCQEALILSEMGAVQYDSGFISHCNEIIDKMQIKFDKTANTSDDKSWVNYDMIRKYNIKRKGGK